MIFCKCMTIFASYLLLIWSALLIVQACSTIDNMLKWSTFSKPSDAKLKLGPFHGALYSEHNGVTFVTILFVTIPFQNDYGTYQRIWSSTPCHVNSLQYIIRNFNLVHHIQICNLNWVCSSFGVYYHADITLIIIAINMSLIPDCQEVLGQLQ